MPGLSAWSYLGGVAFLGVLAGSAFVSARVACRRLVPDWTGAPRIVAGVALVVVVSELLGAVGAFRRWPLLAVSAALAVAASWTLRRRRAPAGAASASGRTGHVELAVAVGALALAFEPWLQAVRLAGRQGITNVDSVWYHLPAAADFAQDGWVTRLHYFGDSAHSFLPWSSELLHALGMVAFHADLLSLVLNLAWAALALLAAWCVGRPYGVAPATLVAVGVVLAVPSWRAPSRDRGRTTPRGSLFSSRPLR